MPSSRGSSQPGDQTQVPTLRVDSLPTEQPGTPLAMHTSWKMSLLSALMALSLTPVFSVSIQCVCARVLSHFSHVVSSSLRPYGL